MCKGPDSTSSADMLAKFLVFVFFACLFCFVIPRDVVSVLAPFCRYDKTL